MNDILIAEISGKRPGGSDKRPTEKFDIRFDKVIISNNSEGYVTNWPIINVPDDYREWYCQNIKNSENAWYAPMNRSYAIKYAREHGYKYLVQLDDNITDLEIAYYDNHKDGVRKRFRLKSKIIDIDDYFHVLRTVLENTNAAMAGCQLAGTATPTMKLMIEGYVYSLFMLKLDCCPDVFQGDFEDDVEYRLKCAQMGMPVIQVCPLRYGKTGQKTSKDTTGCRAEYVKAGLKRGEHMSKLYATEYSCHMSRHKHSTHSHPDKEAVNFKHILKPFKVGVIIKNKEAIQNAIADIFRKYAVLKPCTAIVKTKRVRG